MSNNNEMFVEDVLNFKVIHDSLSFEDRKNGLYSFLNNDDVKHINKPADDEKEIFMIFIGDILGKIEMMTNLYSYGNGQIDLEMNFFCPNPRIIFNVLKKISFFISMYIGVRIGNFKFIFKDNNFLEKIVFWFDVDGIYDDSDCYAKCEDYELIVNGASFVVK